LLVWSLSLSSSEREAGDVGKRLRYYLVRWTSSLLILLGLLLIVGTLGLYGYGQYEQARLAREAAAIAPAVPDAWTPLPEPTLTPTAIPTGGPSVAGERDALRLQEIADRGAMVPAIPPTPTPPATATPVPISPPLRIVAPSIGLDSKVVESPIVNGEWQVPKFVAGHLQGTANPGQDSNVALAGHIESISSGNVFANIGNLKKGDVIRLYTKTTVVMYTVSRVEVVKNTDLSVVQPTPHEQVTLITCTGTWLPLQHDYDRRLIVIGERTS
jgi:LPXTG-site transpeptidase (sortase) family protein